MNRSTHFFPARDYHLAATLDCGQAFRWRQSDCGWEGVVAGRWVRLRGNEDGIEAETTRPQNDWRWLADYLQVQVAYEKILTSFPKGDKQLQAAVRAHRGLRLLRQPPWECLASFILSSTKQVPQIKAVIALLCERFGENVPVPDGAGEWWSFPTADRLAAASDAELRECKMGFRAPYLLGAAKAVSRGALKLETLGDKSLVQARTELMQLDGVGEKIADCVLIFAYGFPEACPVDVWIARGLRDAYFGGRDVPLRQLREFAATHWRGCGGYAQQYVFHHLRTRGK